MRTTLKRGTRHWEQAGNGRSGPAGPLSFPIVRYRQPSPPGHVVRGLGRFLVNTLLALAILVVGIVAGGYMYLQSEVGKTKAHSKDVKASTKWLAGIPDASAPVIALVIGYDQRAGAEHTDVSRSDTLMLVRADPEPDGDPSNRSISLFSFPRDLRVPIYCPSSSKSAAEPSPVYMTTDKINAAYSLCGAEGSLLTVKELTGLPINYVVAVNFRGFKQIVAHMGGVWMDVDRRYFNDNSNAGYGQNYATIDLQPGYQRLNGSNALDYVRYRHGDSDLFRIERQQMFLRAFKERAAQLSIADLPKIVGTISKNIEVGQKGGGSLPIKTVLSYALLAYRLPSGHFIQARVPLANVQEDSGTSDLTVSDQSLQQAIEAFANPDVEAATRAAGQNGVARVRRPSVLPPEKTTVLVLNASHTEGLARDTSYGLGQRGYKTVEAAGGQAANYPGSELWHSVVYYDPAQKGSKAAAGELAKLFRGADVKTIVPAVARMANGAMLVVALGETFDGTLPPMPVQEDVPEKQAPRTTINPSLTRSQLISVRRRLHFRLEVPTVVESSSVLSTQSGLRVYGLGDNHHTVRLTFKMASDMYGYWGIQEMNWADAPVLQGTHFSHRIHGRDYDFYYSGTHLHMVVLRENGASYWVVNTLLDKISNETMIAIAKGLRPLPQ
jgi:LCP family protein required for cell wall assembly